MGSWAELEAAEPGFAARVKARFDAGRHKFLATLRRDGSPRLSGLELEFGEELSFGVMPDSVKERDLLRDPRLAIHSASPDPPAEHAEEWPGDAKLSGRAVEVSGAGAEVRTFHIDLEEVVLTTVITDPDRLVVESWHPGRGLERRERS